MTRPIRLAVRGILMHNDRLLLVNAYKGRGDLWCAPGGGAEIHQSLPENLAREIHEETGLTVQVGTPCLLNEFHDPDGDFHQVEVFFRCTLAGGKLEDTWQDPEHIVSLRRWVTREELDGMTVRPRSLAAVAWGDRDAPVYDALEVILP
ncbi:NUDIX hydrolase [Octadecabacter sp. 1_MG-2023]|uniref:NUDIX domain-containing protein n=1 Tax=unclassified Octadecabacter TaxID=196158 RepID=UPI001C091C45|nr:MULTISPECIES: NUDIX hydrolase [unclassified Octadecabacter]MBU2991936.1 NUDIX hydrolase [Octadecabacter sp. B2R22]MDO6735910.1 NUDIX hydrolase [Octadecabacter sp. 1_MG-2023]